VDVVTVQLADATSGAYTVTLNHAILHGAGDENNAPRSPHVTDHDGDPRRECWRSASTTTPQDWRGDAPTLCRASIAHHPSTTGWIEAAATVTSHRGPETTASTPNPAPATTR
jgi:hypothetical protein